MDHFQVKLFGRASAGFDLGLAIPVFHRWIQNRVLAELLIDVADYRHVPGGPGVLLVAHDAHYGLEHSGALVYTRRTPLSGAVPEKIRAALEAAASAAARLQAEPEFAQTLAFERRHCRISVNDRLLAPNTPETRARLEPELRVALDGYFGSGTYDLRSAGTPRDLLSFEVVPSLAPSPAA